jgi:cyclophilin family peptidyl-prolyl cis-trans isomerase/HEAT repeat protein
VASPLRSSLLLFGLLVPACAPGLPPATVPGPAPTPTPTAPARLEAHDIEAVALLLRMEDARALDARLAERLLFDANPEVRARAAVASGRVKDRAAAPLLLRALQDADATVRARTAFALGVLGDSSGTVVAALSAVALDDAATPAAEAVAALGRLEVEAARPAVDSLLRRHDAPTPVREAALLAAWRLPRDAGTTALITRWTTHDDPETRWRAVYALVRGAGPPAVTTLIRALEDGDDRVRANAARGLRAPIADSAGLRQAALAGLLTATADPHPHVRINALRALPTFDEAARAAPRLRAGMDDTDVNVAIAAAQSLAEAGVADAAPELRRIAVDAERPDGLRTAALSAWMRLDPAAAAAVAVQWADSSRWILRYHAARSLGAAPWPIAGGPLRRFARDASPLVAAEALAAVRAAADTAAESRPIYIEGLGASHALVRAAAARGIAHLAGPADLDLLLQAYAQAQHDTIRDSAIAALEGLGRVAAAGVPVDRTFFLRFGRSGTPRDPAVHRAILEHVGATPADWGAPRTLPEPRPLDFYTEIVQRLVAEPLADSMPPLVGINTPHGEIVLELASTHAPLTVLNFLSLIERGYYTGMRWHRVVPNFVIQDGDPRGDGLGGPGYAIRDEINPLRYLRGTLGMALAGPDTGGSQFFITHSPQPHLDGGYTVFGRVVDGLEVVDRVVQEEPILGFRRIR